MHPDTNRHIPLEDHHVLLANQKKFVGIAYQGRLLDENPSRSLEMYVQKCKKNGIKCLIKAKYMVTNRCNQNCYYCYNKETFLKSPVSFLQSKKIMSRLASSGIKFIQYHGGEPTVYSDFGSLLQWADSLEMFSSFFTNGSSPFWLKPRLRRER